MSYKEMIVKALKGKSVNATAKIWGMPQSTLDRFARGESLPDYRTALMIAKEAGISAEEAFIALAEEEEKKKGKVLYNTDRADVAQLVEQLIRNQ